MLLSRTREHVEGPSIAIIVNLVGPKNVGGITLEVYTFIATGKVFYTIQKCP